MADRLSKKPSCTKILLAVRTPSAAIALNYSVDNIRNDVRHIWKIPIRLTSVGLAHARPNYGMRWDRKHPAGLCHIQGSEHIKWRMITTLNRKLLEMQRVQKRFASNEVHIGPFFLQSQYYCQLWKLFKPVYIQISKFFTDWQTDKLTNWQTDQVQSSFIL